MSKKSVLVLLSGGIDSTVLAKHYLTKGYEVTGLYVDYGQKWSGEYLNFVSVVDELGISLDHVITYPIPMSVEDKFFVPMRNAHLLTVAVAYAINPKYSIHRYPNVAIGVCHGEFLDTRPEFIDRFNFMLDFCLKDPIYVLAPFAHWSVERVIKYGIKIGAPLHLTRSCMEYPPCGICHKCKVRQKYNIEPLPVEIILDSWYKLPMVEGKDY